MIRCWISRERQRKDGPAMLLGPGSDDQNQSDTHRRADSARTRVIRERMRTWENREGRVIREQRGKREEKEREKKKSERDNELERKLERK